MSPSPSIHHRATAPTTNHPRDGTLANLLLVPSDRDDLESRVAALEQQVGLIAQDAAAARVLAGAADRDVSEFRTVLHGHTAVLNAIRETQLDQSERLTTVESGFSNLGGRLERVESKVDDASARIRSVDEHLAEVKDFLVRAL